MNNLPSNVTVTINVSKNKTTIELDFGTHPKDVDRIHEVIQWMCSNVLDKTESFNNELNDEEAARILRAKPTEPDNQIVV